MFSPVSTYFNDNGNDRYPLWPRLLLPYTKNSQIFREPSNISRTPWDAADTPGTLHDAIDAYW